MKAKKKYGQNFLIDNAVLDKISSCVLACEKDLIIEIGPGRGALTNKLLYKKANVLAYEIDNDLIPILNMFKNSKLTVKNIDFLESEIKEDIKNFDYKKLFIVGNLPYYITTPIIEKIIKSKLKHESLTVMVQLEVANRFAANIKSKDYGYFTVFLQHFYDVVKVVDVDSKSFDPAPKVKSAVITLTPKKDVKVMDEKYFEFLKSCFKEKRKTLRNNLREYDFNIVESVLLKYNLSPLARAEECVEEVFIEIYEKNMKNALK